MFSFGFEVGAWPSWGEVEASIAPGGAAGDKPEGVAVALRPRLPFWLDVVTDRDEVAVVVP